MTGELFIFKDETDYSFIMDCHYILANTSRIMIFLGPSIGFVGTSISDTKWRVALATCFEYPFLRKRILQNISVGLVLYYPTYYFLSGTLNPDVGI